MANTAISDIASEIDKTKKMSKDPILGDGTAKAGMAIGRLSTGKAVAIDADSATAGISFYGIMDKAASLGIDTAITDALLNNALHPKSGDVIPVFVEDPGAAVQAGAPLTLSQATAGSFVIISTKAATGNLAQTIALTGDVQDIVIEDVYGYLEQNLANGDTVAWMRWK